MGKASRRPGRDEIKRKRKEVKQAQKLLRTLQKAEGRSPVPKATRPNRMSPYETVEEEQEAIGRDARAKVDSRAIDS